MRKTVLSLVLLLLCISVCQVFAADNIFAEGSCGADAFWAFSDDGVLTVSGSGPMDDFRYSGDVPWKDVRDNIVSVVVEDGITKVGQNAFYWCRNLTDVILPRSLTAIGSTAFTGCSNLSQVNVPDSVTSIGKEAFRGCSSLNSIHIPGKLELIDDYTFYGCDKLASVTLPESLKTIGNSAFSNCDTLTEIVIPASVESISENGAFTDCSSLQKFTVDPENPNYSSADGVLFNKDQTRLLYYPAGRTNAFYSVAMTVTDINVYAFYSNHDLVSITVPGTVKTIGNYAFAYCNKLSQIIFGEGLESIGEGAFTGCSSLPTISFPASLVVLGSNPFEYCRSLSSINASAGSATFSSVGGVLFSADKSVLIAYPHGIASRTYRIPDGVRMIGNHAFLNNSNLESVTFPDSLTAIGVSSFAGCDKLTGVTFPDGLETIDTRAFNSCDGLTEVVLPESVISIGSSAFSWCDNLVSVTVMNPETALDKWGVFDFCSEDLTITGWAGSTAETYAADADVPFIELKAAAEPEPEVTEEPAEQPSEIPAKEPEAEEPVQESSEPARSDEHDHDHTGEAGTWACAECGAEMNGGNYCSRCGAPRPQGQVCPSCGYEVPEGMTMNFCPVCGTKLDIPRTRINVVLEDLDYDELLNVLDLVEAEIGNR